MVKAKHLTTFSIWKKRINNFTIKNSYICPFWNLCNFELNNRTIIYHIFNFIHTTGILYRHLQRGVKTQNRNLCMDYRWTYLIKSLSAKMLMPQRAVFLLNTESWHLLSDVYLSIWCVFFNCIQQRKVNKSLFEYF